MQGVYLKLYVPQTVKHDGTLLYEWLLKQAHGMGIHGGSVFRAVACFGRHGRLHEEHFFELAGDLPVTVEFFATDDAILKLLTLLKNEQISLFYIKLPAEGAVTTD